MAARSRRHDARMALAPCLLLLAAACANDARETPTSAPAPAPITISISPREALLDPPTPIDRAGSDGTQVQLTATGGFEDLTVRDVTNEVTWESTRPDVVSVNAHGLAVALASGSAGITGTLRGAFGIASITVRDSTENAGSP